MDYFVLTAMVSFLFLCVCRTAVKDWPIERSFEEAVKLHAKKTVDERKGYDAVPLFEIPFTHIIPDTLHLFLRIMGKLVAQVRFWNCALRLFVVGDLLLLLLCLQWSLGM